VAARDRAEEKAYQNGVRYRVYGVRTPRGWRYAVCRSAVWSEAVRTAAAATARLADERLRRA